jgi:uncharacterized protein Yka (UPF0111/DUF47 family)
MTAESAALEKHIKKATIISNIVAAAVAIASSATLVYAFYYDTTKTLERHESGLNEVIIEVNQINNTLNDNAVFQGVSKTEIEALKKQMTGVETKVDRIDEKLDKILFQTRE